MTDKFINVNQLNEKIKTEQKNNANMGMSVIYDWFIEKIKNEPAADVQPVVHGYWEEVTDYGGWGDTHYRCSVCSEEWYLEDGKPKDNNMNFCPRCGARMDGDVE